MRAYINFYISPGGFYILMLAALTGVGERLVSAQPETVKNMMEYLREVPLIDEDCG